MATLTPVTQDPIAANSAASAIASASNAAISATNAATSATNSAASAASTAGAVASTTANATSTAADAVATAADRVQTGLDVVSAAASATAALVSENNAATSAASTAGAVANTAADAVATTASAAAALASENNAAASAASVNSGVANGTATLDVNTEVVELSAGAAAEVVAGRPTNVKQADGTWSTKIAETSATGSAIIPVGTTAQRDVTPTVGYQRWNTTLGRMEVWDGTAWSALGGGGKILQVVGKTITTQGSQTLAANVDTQVGAGVDFILDVVPVATGSSFLIEYRWFGEVYSAWNVVFNVHRDGVRVNNTGLIKAGLSMATQTFDSTTVSNDSSTPEIMHLRTLDKSGSTAGTSIQFKLVAAAMSVAKTMWTNRCFSASTVNGYEHGVSEVIITEIAA